MDDLREYLLSVIIAAMISGIVLRLVKGNRTFRSIVKVLCGLFVAYTAIKPIPMLNLSGLSTFVSQYSADAKKVVQSGTDMSTNVLRESIKEQSQAYILDKAKILKADLQVEVELTEDDIPIPKRVSITGKVSPYAREKLSAIIKRDLGIDMEYQVWN